MKLNYEEQCRRTERTSDKLKLMQRYFSGLYTFHSILQKLLCTEDSQTKSDT